jgi:nucleoside-diphosphate-sugar epimerase
MAEMRVLVIGGTRFIGPPVVARLCELGWEVALFHRGQTHADLPAGVRHILGDRHQLSDYAGTLRRFAPQVALDMIPMVEQDAHDVMHAFKGLADRVVAISSQDVYAAYGRLIGTEPGLAAPRPLNEDAPLRTGLYPYRGEQPRAPEDPLRWLDDYDKILIERVIMGDPDLPGTTLRLPMVYGPRDAQHRLFEYLKRMDDGRPAILLEAGLASWCWTRGYVENVAAAITLAVTDERAAGRVYNVGQAEALATASWVRKIGQAAGWSGEIIVVPGDRLPEHLKPGIHTAHHLIIDSMRIREELGYAEQIPLDEGLRRTVAWERSHPPKKIDPKLFDYAAEDALLAGFV